MASAAAGFVTEVLATAGELKKEGITSKLSTLNQRIWEVKFEVHDSLQKKYVDFYPQLNATEHLSHRVDNLQRDMKKLTDNLKNEIESQLNTSTGEFQDLALQLDETNGILRILEQLVKIEEALKVVDKALGLEEYAVAAENLETIWKVLSESSNERRTEIKILNTLNTEYRVRYEQLICTLGEKWCGILSWVLPDEDSQRGEKDKVELQLLVPEGEDKKTMKQIVQALADTHTLGSKLKSTGNKLLENVLKPIIKENRTDVSVLSHTHGKKKKVLQVIGRFADCEIPAPSEVFVKLNTVLEFLNKHVFGLEVKMVTEEGKSVTRTLMEELGAVIADDMLNCIVKECLSYSIPTSNKEFDKYNQVVTMTENFNKSLVKLKFIPASNDHLLHFVGNINVLFANKKCHEILEKARKLMNCEMHNTVQISDQKPSGPMPNLVSGGEKDKDKQKGEPLQSGVLSNQTKLSRNTFMFPVCHISVSVQSLMTLVYDTLQEACSSSPQCAVQLYYCVRNMFELFRSAVQKYHKESLETLPLLSALHHNNCMYIAHHLLTLGHQFRKDLDGHLNEGVASFVDMVPTFRHLATDCFQQQMTRQKTQCLEYLKGAHGFSSVSEDNRYHGAERAVKQVLHHLQHLGRVWMEVLPKTMYCNAIGALLNCVVVEMIGCITNLEDISADDATQLHALLNMVTDRAPELFHFSDDKASALANLNKKVSKWTKFKELILVLNASLLDISDRWAQGKGPLASEFTGNEVKQLIRALFQNTDRRAAVLAKIK